MCEQRRRVIRVGRACKAIIVAAVAAFGLPAGREQELARCNELQRAPQLCVDRAGGASASHCASRAESNAGFRFAQRVQFMLEPRDEDMDVRVDEGGVNARVDESESGGGEGGSRAIILRRSAGVHPCSRRPSSSQTLLPSILHPVRQQIPFAATPGLHSAAPCSWHSTRACASVTLRPDHAPFGTL